MGLCDPCGPRGPDEQWLRHQGSPEQTHGSRTRVDAGAAHIDDAFRTACYHGYTGSEPGPASSD